MRKFHTGFLSNVERLKLCLGKRTGLSATREFLFVWCITLTVNGDGRPYVTNRAHSLLSHAEVSALSCLYHPGSGQSVMEAVQAITHAMTSWPFCSIVINFNHEFLWAHSQSGRHPDSWADQLANALQLDRDVVFCSPSSPRDVRFGLYRLQGPFACSRGSSNASLPTLDRRSVAKHRCRQPRQQRRNVFRRSQAARLLQPAS
jgi:hypothetical protein